MKRTLVIEIPLRMRLGRTELPPLAAMLLNVLRPALATFSVAGARVDDADINIRVETTDRHADHQVRRVFQEGRRLRV